MLVTDSKADGYWTLDDSELKFRLSSREHHVFREHYYLPLDTLKVTGPLMVDFYVNGHLLDKTIFAKDGEVVYQHDVPMDWLTPGSITLVRMRVHNPYVAPRDGARLGVLLRSAAPLRSLELSSSAVGARWKYRAKHRLRQFAG